MRRADVLSLLILAAVLAGILLGIRKGRSNRTAALAAARAEGRAEATAALQATLQQSVTVHAGNVHGSSESSLDGMPTPAEVASYRRFVELLTDRQSSMALRSSEAPDVALSERDRYLESRLRLLRELPVPGEVEVRALGD